MMRTPTIQEQLEQLAQEYTEALKKQFALQLVSVVLFGSVSRQEAGPTSDIDLLLVLEGLPRGRFARKALFDEIDAQFWPTLVTLESQGIGCRFSRLILTPQEASQIVPLYLDLAEDAVLLYDRGDFFKEVLQRLRMRLKELGAVRHRMGEFRFWDLKPGLKPGERFEL